MRCIVNFLSRFSRFGVFAVLLAGCASNPSQRYAGHWVEGGSYSNFVDSHDSRTYLLYDQLPPDVEALMAEQHGYPCPNSQSGTETAVRLVFEGYPTIEHTYDADATPAGTELHITKMISYGPAEPGFIQSRENAAASEPGSGN
jgi:hypothetical protein